MSSFRRMAPKSLWRVPSESGFMMHRRTKRLICSRNHTRGIWSCAYSPDGTILAGGGADGTLLLWDTTTRQLRTKLKRHGRRIVTLAFAFDGSMLASGADYEDAVQLWDVAEAKYRTTFIGHTEGIRAVAFSLDSRTLASGSRDGSVRIWDVVTGEHRVALTTAPVSTLAFSPDSRTLAVGSRNNAVQLWDLQTDQLRDSFIGHTDSISTVAFSPDGNSLVSADVDGVIRLWDADTGPAARNHHSARVIHLFRYVFTRW